MVRTRLLLVAGILLASLTLGALTPAAADPAWSVGTELAGTATVQHASAHAVVPTAPAPAAHRLSLEHARAVLVRLRRSLLGAAAAIRRRARARYAEASVAWRRVWAPLADAPDRAPPLVLAA